MQIFFVSVERIFRRDDEARASSLKDVHNLTAIQQERKSKQVLGEAYEPSKLL